MRPSRINLFTVVLLIVGVLLVGVGAYAGRAFLQRREARLLGEAVDARVAEGDTRGAVEALERYLSLRPGDNRRLGQLARILVQRVTAGEADDREKALTRDALRASVARMPDELDLRESWAKFLIGGGDKEAALTHLDYLRGKLTADGDDPEAFVRVRLMLAQTAITIGDGVTAEDALRELVAAAGRVPVPREAFVLLTLVVSEGRREPKAAEDVLEKMVSVMPDDAEAWRFVGSWKQRYGRSDEAAQAAARARALAPDDPGVLLLDATLALARGDVPRAAEILEGPLADAPPSVDLAVARADLAIARNDVAGAIAILRRAIEEFPSDRRLLQQLVTLAADGGRLDDLREYLPAAKAALGAEASAVCYSEAVLAMAEQRWVAALRSWEKVRGQVSADAAIARRIDLAMARCHAALGQTDLATEARRRATGDAPRSLTALLLEAESLEQSGRASEALALVARVAATMAPDDFASTPAVWQPLLRLRIADTVRRPPQERDWSTVDGLLDTLAASGKMPAPVLEPFQWLVLEAKGEGEKAVVAAREAVASRPDDPATAARLLHLLGATGHEEEAFGQLASYPEAVRHSAEVLATVLSIAAGLGRERADVWVAEVEKAIDSLPEPEALAVRRRWMAFEARRGRPSAAERIGAGIVASVPDDLPVRQVLLDLAWERADGDAVAAQSAAIVDLAGGENAVGRVARAAALLQEALDDAGTPETDTDGYRAKLDEVVTLLDAAEKERPTWPDIERQRAALAAVKGDRSAAIGHLRRAIAAGEEIPWAKRRLVAMLVAAGRYDEAIPVIGELGEQGGPAVECLLADVAEASGDVAGALKIAAAAIPADCMDAGQLSWYARLLARSGRVAEAEEVCRRAIAAAPGRAGPRTTLVGIQAAAGERASAEETAREALATLQGRVRTRFETEAALILGNGDEVERRLREAVAAAPKDPGAALRLAEHLLAAGRTREGREILETVAGMPPEEGATAVNAARRRLAVFLGSGPNQADLSRALRILARNGTGEADPTGEDLALAAAILVGRPDPASWRRGLAQLESLEAIRPLSVEERVTRARTRARLGARQRIAAREELKGIAESADGSVGVLAMLVEAWLDDDPEEAGRWLARLQSVAPNAPGTHLLGVRVARALGDEEAAARAAARIVPDLPVTAASAATLAKAAEIVEQAGFPEHAEPVFRQMATLSDDGRLRWARFLGRRRRTSEALDEIEALRGVASPAAILDALVSVCTDADADGVAETRPRVERLVETILRENADSPGLTLKVAGLAHVSGRSAEAIAAYRELLAGDTLAPIERAIASGNLALELARPETAAEAEKLVEKSIEELGPIPPLLDTRAVVRLAKGQLQSALESMNDAVLEPNPVRFLHLAAILAKQGDLEAAGEALRKAVELGLDDRRLSAIDAEHRSTVEEALRGGA